jgi:dephospho-CoA kinase
VGLIGHFGTGKDTAAQYLSSKYGFTVYSIYEPIRVLAQDFFGRVDRKTLNLLGKRVSHAFGNDIFIRWCADKIVNGNTVVKDARYINEISWLSKVSDAVICLEADPELVLKRIKRRGREADPTSLDELKTLWSEEGDLNEVRSDGIVKIDNSGGLEELYSKLERLVEELRAKKESRVEFQKDIL